MENQKKDQLNDDDCPPELEDFTEQLQQMNISKQKKGKKDDVYIGDYADIKNQEQSYTPQQNQPDQQKEDQQKLFKEFGGSQGDTYLPQQKPLQSQPQNQITAKNEEKKKQQQSNDSGENFTGGFKKGFLSQDNSAKQTKTKQNTEQENITVVTANPNENKKNKLEIPEVQAAMNLKTNLQENQKQWLNEDLLKNIGSNPQMAKLFTNPEYLHAISLMEKNPKEVMEKYGKNPEFQLILQEFFKIMGGHFSNLSEKDQLKKQQEQQQEQLKKKQETEKQQKIQELTPQQQKLSNDPEIQEILKDQKIQKILKYLEKNQKLDFTQILQSSDYQLQTKIRILIEKGYFNLQH